MFNTLKSDLKSNNDPISKIVCIVYRFGNYSKKNKIPVIKQMLIILYRFLLLFVSILSHSHIYASSEIGGGMKLMHGANGLIISPKAVIGENARIYHQVTIGVNHTNKAPVIGDNVYIGAGAKIIGDIRIGDNVTIGANAVVTKNLPDNCVAVGIPAKIIKIKS